MSTGISVMPDGWSASTYPIGLCDPQFGDAVHLGQDSGAFPCQHPRVYLFRWGYNLHLLHIGYQRRGDGLQPMVIKKEEAHRVSHIPVSCVWRFRREGGDQGRRNERLSNAYLLSRACAIPGINAVPPMTRTAWRYFLIFSSPPAARALLKMATSRGSLLASKQTSKSNP